MRPSRFMTAALLAAASAVGLGGAVEVSYPDRNGDHRQARASYVRKVRRGKGKKVSTAARRANVMGKQAYAGKTFISYAQHDRLTLAGASERAAFWSSK